MQCKLTLESEYDGYEINADEMDDGEAYVSIIRPDGKAYYLAASDHRKRDATTTVTIH